MRKIRRAIKCIARLALAVLLAIGALATVTALAAEYNVVLDGGSTAGDSVSVANGTITITTGAATDAVNLSGNSDGYSVIVVNATNINIADNTIITGSEDKAGLTVPDGSTVTGQGDGITITGGNGNISGGSSTNGGVGGGICANGDITISEYATVDTISGGNGDYGSFGIYAYGAITISGTIGNISGGSSTNGVGGDGIYAYGAITINGIINGDISGGVGSNRGGDGIYSSSGNITISATVTVDANISGDVTVNGTLINNGTIIINVGKTITNNGTITNSGTITNNGTITNSASGTITNNGTITNTGTFINNGTINGTNIYTVTYNANGGSGDNQTVTLPNGVSQTVLANPFTRSGYSFNGWNTAADGTGDSYAAGAAIPADTTLYAQWKRNSSGGGSATTQPTTKVGDADVNYSIDNKGVVTLKPTPQQLDKIGRASCRERV